MREMKKTLFFADDSPMILAGLAEIFSRFPGIKIAGTADSVDSSIESIMKLKPDIIILGYKFKEGTGVDILKHIRKNKYNSIVIFYSIHFFSEYKKQCLKEGADFFFNKISETKKLIKKIRNLVENNNKLQIRSLIEIFTE